MAIHIILQKDGKSIPLKYTGPITEEAVDQFLTDNWSEGTTLESVCDDDGKDLIPTLFADPDPLSYE